jgi:hypothetical protein
MMGLNDLIIKHSELTVQDFRGSLGSAEDGLSKVIKPLDNIVNEQILESLLSGSVLSEELSADGQILHVLLLHTLQLSFILNSQVC